MTFLEATMARLAAAAAESVAHRQAARAKPSRSAQSSCTPCAAKDFVEKARAQVYGKGKR